MYKRCNIKKLAICIFLIMQITLLFLYWITQDEKTTTEKLHNLNYPVKFIKINNNNVTKNKTKYFDKHSKITLMSRNVGDLFEDFNTSVCYKKGTDLKLMKRSKDLNWKCVCLSGWHGNDCGQPEVIWRALLAFRKGPVIPTTRKKQRHVVYFTEFDYISSAFAEIAIYELKDTVDLFIITNLNNITNVKNKLDSGFLNDISEKILYLDSRNRNEVWRITTKIVQNFKDDDIFFINNPYEVPNAKALQFLKIYNKWPEPLIFRLRWSVYGFFWTHPQKTILSSGACTLKYLYEALDNEITVLKNISNYLTINKQGLIIGDLNHFGGWFCEFCNEPAKIIQSLNLNLLNKTLVSQNLAKKKINVEFIEDLIENGIYLDGKTNLKRAHRSNDNYYAPSIVHINSWKYDWLLINLYSKMDYY